MSAWTFDELYGRDGKFLDGLESRQQVFVDSQGDQIDRISVEQVRSAMNVWLDAADLPPTPRRQRFEEEIEKQQYYQRRNKQARKSHTKTRFKRLAAVGVDPDRIKSCIPDPQTQ